MEKRVSIYDMHTYLPHVLLRQDKAGMAANVENRVPYLYPQVVRFGLGVKTNFDTFGAKTPLKKVALKYLPKELVLRRKCGFGLPIGEWFRDDGLFTKRLLDLRKHPVIKDYFNVRKVSKLVSEHISGKEDNSSILFSFVALATWYDVFISSD